MNKLVTILCAIAFVLKVSSQTPYKIGDLVNEFTINTTLNTKQSFSTLKNINGNIVVLDFFGTWCVPCIKALPTLTALQQKYTGKLSILLISIEEEQRLKDFIAQRKNLSLPIVVDKGEAITQLFQPPAYPYTIVLNEERKIIAITKAENLTENYIDSLLAIKQPENIMVPQKPVVKQLQQAIVKEKMPINPIIALSEQFIYAAKTGTNTASLITNLQTLPFDSLHNFLVTDSEKKAFWINIYNGFTHVFLDKNPERYKNRSSFFSAKQITIAGKLFSLDAIEHGILRRSKIKWSEGYLNKWFPSKIEKELRVDTLDYRIHFALNCGAKSCPPIAFYNASKINEQLDIATKAYLNGEADYNARNNTLQLPTLMSWFRHDFGGKKQMLRLAKQLGIVPADKQPTIHFKKYDWNLYLNNFKN
ncbi:DUF547 domain-containing protein [Parasediminibacterium paludis]|uniref:DUF547 domain-containing protein n=1 Tax=Parasediminibacterium paludis TaxID=908966 RepID=A0ABV8PTT7_9BACT